MQGSFEPVVLVTGGARRLGAAIVRHLHARGLSVVVHYRSSVDEARRLKAELEALRPGTVALASVDILAPDAPRILVEAALERFGRLDMLVNNASTFYETPVDTASYAQWDDLMGTNLRAPFFLCQAAAPHLAAHSGAIVNLIDVHAQRPLKDFPIYSVAKAGLAMLTQSLARELAPRVRVNGVAPGAILWPEAGADEAERAQVLARIPLHRTGAPEDIARAVTFLLLDAPYVTGQILAVDGGRSTML
jgi:pteridine reductase